MAANIDPGIATPLDFDAPEPEDRPQGPAPVDFTKDTTPIFKSHAKHKVAPGTFRNTMPDQHGTPIGG